MAKILIYVKDGLVDYVTDQYELEVCICDADCGGEIPEEFNDLAEELGIL